MIKKINQERYLTSLDLLEIIPINIYHETSWKELWKLYCGNEVSENTIRLTWDKIIDDSSSVNGVIAVHDNKLIGFLTYVIHESTREIKSVCHIEDLYIDKHYRGRKLNVGLRLIRHLMERLNAGEWSKLYCIAKLDNHTVRSMCDQFMISEDYKLYVVKSI